MNRFAGERFEAELGRYDLRARFYDPEVGWFTQRDSFEGWERRPVTLHRYLYANGEPVDWVDPTGELAFFANTIGGWTRVVALLGITGYLVGVGTYTFQRRDSRKELYLDTSWIKISEPCSKEGCWDRPLLIDKIISTMKESFKDYGIELYWEKPSLLGRRI